MKHKKRRMIDIVMCELAQAPMGFTADSIRLNNIINSWFTYNPLVMRPEFCGLEVIEDDSLEEGEFKILYSRDIIHENLELGT